MPVSPTKSLPLGSSRALLRLVELIGMGVPLAQCWAPGVRYCWGKGHSRAC